MAPVQYMQQPYVVPQAPLYPADYRRVLSQHYSFPPAQEVNFLQHAEQVPLQRETACSEAQTEPYESVGKNCEKPAAEDMDSNCAVISSTPAAIQYPGKEEVQKGSDRPGVGAPLPQRVRISSQTPGDSAIQQSSLNESGHVLCDAESSQGCLEECVLSDVMPLDGSSVNDVYLTEKGTEELEYQHLAGPDGHQREDAVNPPYPDSGVHECGQLTQSLESKRTHSPPQGLPPNHDSNLVKGSDPVPEADSVIPGTGDVEDLPFRILRLPCTQMTTTCLLEKPDPLWYAGKVSSLLSPESCLLRADGYNYYPHADQERQSVLSPSLDELSSRDELFSTDVEDVDLVSESVPVEGGRLTDEGSDSYSTPRKGDLENAGLEEGCTACQETCSTCGLRLMAQREYVQSTEYCGGRVLDEADSDCTNLECEDEWSSYEVHEVPVKNRQWRSASPCYRSPKYKPKKDYRGGMGREEQAEGYLRGLECCERKTTARMDKNTGGSLRSAPPKTYSGKRRMLFFSCLIFSIEIGSCTIIAICFAFLEWGEGTLASDREGWGNCGKPKAKPWKPGNRNQELGRLHFLHFTIGYGSYFSLTNLLGLLALKQIVLQILGSPL